MRQAAQRALAAPLSATADAEQAISPAPCKAIRACPWQRTSWPRCPRPIDPIQYGSRTCDGFAALRAAFGNKSPLSVRLLQRNAVSLVFSGGNPGSVFLRSGGVESFLATLKTGCFGSFIPETWEQAKFMISMTSNAFPSDGVASRPSTLKHDGLPPKQAIKPIIKKPLHAFSREDHTIIRHCWQTPKKSLFYTLVLNLMLLAIVYLSTSSPPLMRNSSFLQRFKSHSAFAAVLAALSLPTLNVPQAYAFGGGSGNPFGNGSFFPNTGTFQATIRGTNVSGVAVFSTSSGGAGGGSFTIYNGASTYIGNINSSISGNTLSATMEASLPGTGQGTSSSTVSSTFGLTSRTFISGETNKISGGTNEIQIVTPEIIISDTGRINSITTSNVIAPTSEKTITGATETKTETGPTTNETIIGAQTNSVDTITTTAGDILVFQIPAGTGAGALPGGVVIVSTNNAVTLQPGLPPESNEIDPALPGLGSTITTSETNRTGLQTNTVSTIAQTDTVSTIDQTNFVITEGQTNTTFTEDITGANTNTTSGGTNITRTITPDQETTTADRIEETYGLINTVANSSYNDVNYVSGSFTANLSNSYPNQVFRGSGAVTFQTVDASGPIPQLVSVTVPIHVTGTRTSNESGSFVPVQVDVPRVFTEFDIQVN